MELWRGWPFPLGASLTPEGTNFSLYSENADKVELCLFDEAGRETRTGLPEQTYKIWHGFAPEITAGQRYGFRVYGPYDPENGHRFNPHKLLVDPYAKAISGRVGWDPSIFGYILGDKAEDLSMDKRDSAPFVPKGIVVDERFDWEGDRHPCTPWHDTVIYEVHVKGFTKLQSQIPEELRGTYQGFSHPVVIDYFKELGVTALELLPVHHYVDEGLLRDKGLHNYWGYNSLGYLAPHEGYSKSRNSWQQVLEFKQMVKNLHAAGLEVILDVVYNHTAEGNHLGPTLSLRGIDNASYYRLTPESGRYYMDYTGCGNTLNVLNHQTLRLIMDSLRYWVIEMHVDGFRFDLASALARGLHEVDQLNTFFAILQQDPVLSQVKLIAEPWDLGEGGYQVGRFPDQWMEWNDKFRDTVRGFWRGEEGLIGELASRLMGSSDLYEPTGRKPHASINLVTAHDGFTLEDLVSYNRKHNEANQEGNRDGSDHNLSWNCGVEGPTHRSDVRNLRAQMKRNFLSTLLLSQGVPMLLGGDEMGRTQKGNNNAYCQDNELSWFHWDKVDHELLKFTQNLIAFRKAHRVFHRRHYYSDENVKPGQNKELIWLLPTGEEMPEEAWDKEFAKCLGIYFGGDHINERDSRNHPIQDNSFIWLLNASHVKVEFRFPKFSHDLQWQRIFDTALGWEFDENAPLPLREYTLLPRASVLLMQSQK